MDLVEFHSGEYLTFHLAGQEFAIDATRVKGIVPMHEMELEEAASAPRAGVRQWLIGRANVHGRPFEVMDLARCLGLPRPARGRNPYIVVVESISADECGIFGFPVDRVCDVVLARARDYSNGKLRIGRSRRVLDADRIFQNALDPAPAC